MKKFFYIILILCLSQSCKRILILSDRAFVYKDLYKVSSLKFINDSICYYEQEFLCEMDEHFRKTINVCSYKVNKSKIILKNKTTHPDSVNATCFKLPEIERKKCRFLDEELKENKTVIIDDPRISKMDLYGYIDNITIDTLYYKKRTIYYGKRNKCSQKLIFSSIPFIEKK